LFKNSSTGKGEEMGVHGTVKGSKKFNIPPLDDADDLFKTKKEMNLLRPSGSESSNIFHRQRLYSDR
jgi:hypothetical protein